MNSWIFVWKLSLLLTHRTIDRDSSPVQLEETRLRKVKAFDQGHICKNHISSLLLLDQGTFHCSAIPTLSCSQERPCLEARRVKRTRSQKWNPSLWGLLEKLSKQPSPPGLLSQAFLIDPMSLSHTCATVCWLCPNATARPWFHPSSLCLTHLFIQSSPSCQALC